MFIKENKKQNYQALGESGMVDEIGERSGTVEHYVRNMYFSPGKRDLSKETTKDDSQQDIVNTFNQVQRKLSIYD